MRGAFTCGLAGLAPTDEETAFLADSRPWGVILFARNCESPDQLRALTDAVRTAAGDGTAVLIDQEGGRVQRMKAPHWPAYPAPRRFGDRHAENPAAAVRAAYLNALLMARDLLDCGIDVNCTPVLDIAAGETHDAIGDRAFSSDPATVAALGRAVCDGHGAAGVMPVLKHIPGQGRAGADTHHGAAIVRHAEDRLLADAAPFAALNDIPAAMTAHVTYDVWDTAPATQSPAIIDGIIRVKLGFGGLLMSDDLSMNALGGNIRMRARTALEAGCDIALHCCGRLDEAVEVAEEAGALEGEPADRAARARRWLTDRRQDELDTDAARAELARLA